uniref:BEN domain containing 2 n=1 Tax=Canis lupus familiaris TaxID=9615 RepID=A0A8I3PRX8_CANLF
MFTYRWKVRGATQHARLPAPLPPPHSRCAPWAGATAQSQKPLRQSSVRLPFGASVLPLLRGYRRHPAAARTLSVKRQSRTPCLTMSEEEDFIIITIEDNSDDDDDINVVIVEDSETEPTETEPTENTLSADGMLTIEPNVQASNYNYQQQSQVTNGERGLPALDDVAVSQVNHLGNMKRHSSNSVDVGLLPLHKRGRSSLRGDNMESCASGGFSDANPQNQPMKLQHHYKGAGGPSVAVQARADPVGTALQPAVLSELQEQVLRESPPLPKIVSTYSLQHSLSPESSVAPLAMSCFVSGGVEGAHNCLAGQPPPAAPTTVQPQGVLRVAHSAHGSTLWEEMPGKAEASLGNSTESIHYPTSLGDDNGQHNVSSSVFIQHNVSSSVFILPNFVITETNLENNPGTRNSGTSLRNGSDQCPSSVSLPPNFAVEKFILIEMPEKSKTSQENSSETVYYPALLGNISGPDTDSSSALVPPNFVEKAVLVEMPEEAETSLENNQLIDQTINYQTSSGNGRGPNPVSSSLSIPPNSRMLFKAETCLGNSTQLGNYSSFLEKDSGQETSEYFFMPSSLVSNAEMTSETMNPPTLMTNDSNQDIDSESFFVTPGFALLPIEILVRAESGTENETMNYPVVLENDNSQDSISSSCCPPSSFGYLGDPRRNVRVLDTHLATAQKKTHPRHAARYLVPILFSKEILMHGWVGVNSQGRQPLDPNKMAAIREYLATIFPNHDLRERGRDWKTCIADINSMIYCSYSEANTIPQTTGGNKKPCTNPDAQSFADLNGRRDGEGSKSSFQFFPQTAASETRENGDSQQNSSACPQGIREPSTDNLVVSHETLEYLGNPDRNVRLPHSMLDIAKRKSRPELAARYLIRNLFPEKVLVKSNVYGNLGHGMRALNPNRISALREFLQDIFPNCSLSEAGHDWKLCVTAINGSIRSLRYDLKKSLNKA